MLQTSWNTSLVLLVIILLAVIVYSLFTATLHIQTFSHAVKSLGLSELTAEPLAAIVLLIPPQETLSRAWVQTRGSPACFEKKKHPSTMTGPGPSLWPGGSLHIIDLAFVLVDLTPVAHNVQYIKLRQQTAPAVWVKLWSLSPVIS